MTGLENVVHLFVPQSYRYMYLPVHIHFALDYRVYKPVGGRVLMRYPRRACVRAFREKY